ncbi:MAG: hypothetical protein O9340_06700 [Cyclobacteriaceae bacterium]|jgi:lysophospholipase L1-like esterase|nr:hypothetical protein [Cyclobacteriaceae bacterium]
MKKYSIFTTLLATALLVGCEQELADLKPPVTTTPTGDLGSINATKFSTLGNSLVAGFQSNALFNEGQEESIGKIINQQLTFAGGTSAFNQPNINSVNGFSGLFNETTPVGRLVLFDPDGSTDPDGAGCLISRSPSPTASGTPARNSTCPSVIETPAMPAPYNTADAPSPFTGDKTALNNFGVPGILLGQTLTPLTGGPSTGNPAYNALYARFASNPGTSTIVGDFIASQPTFFLIEVGNNDVLGYATTGASGAIPLTSAAAFQGQYQALINSILTGPGTLATAKGVVANIPYVTDIPFFKTVAWNSVEFVLRGCDFNSNGTDDVQEQLNQLNGATGFGGYNGALDFLVTQGAITQEEANKRKVTFVAGKNGIVINDENLTPDLTAALSGINPALAAYGRTRQANANDLITLSAGSILGTCVSNNPALINGVSVPLADQFVLLPSEVTEIRNRTDEFNAAIETIVDANPTRLALADVNAAFTDFASRPTGTLVNGILLTPSITPPYAGFSEDGVHPNGRGYAFLANIFIRAINEKFDATIPEADITKYRGTRTPVSPQKSF